MDKSPFRKRLAFGCTCLVAVLLVGLLCLIPAVLTSRNRLSVIGRRVADATNWVRSYDGYYWETNETQVVLTADGRGGQKLRLDDRTASTIPVLLPGIGRDLWTSNPQGERPSPDGKWLLFPHGGAPYIAAVEKSTGRVVKWKPASRSLIYSLWFSDSRRWVEFDQSVDGKVTRPIIHSLDGLDRHTAAISDTFIWPIGVTSDGHVLNARNQLHLELWEYELEGNVQAPKKHPIALPANTIVFEVEGSPDGRHVAYLVQENYGSFITRLLDRILPTQNDPRMNQVSLWVSRSDGSELHRIGFERAFEAAGVQWAPDGKRLSLFMDGGFYIVPVN